MWIVIMRIIIIWVIISISIIWITVAITITIIRITPTIAYAPIWSVVTIMSIAPISAVPIGSVIETISISAIIIDIHGDILRVISPRTVTFITIIFLNNNISILIQSFCGRIGVNIGKYGPFFRKIGISVRFTAEILLVIVRFFVRRIIIGISFL